MFCLRGCTWLLMPPVILIVEVNMEATEREWRAALPVLNKIKRFYQPPDANFSDWRVLDLGNA